MKNNILFGIIIFLFVIILTSCIVSQSATPAAGAGGSTIQATGSEQQVNPGQTIDLSKYYSGQQVTADVKGPSGGAVTVTPNKDGAGASFSFGKENMQMNVNYQQMGKDGKTTGDMGNIPLKGGEGSKLNLNPGKDGSPEISSGTKNVELGESKSGTGTKVKFEGGSETKLFNKDKIETVNSGITTDEQTTHNEVNIKPNSGVIQQATTTGKDAKNTVYNYDLKDSVVAGKSGDGQKILDSEGKPLFSGVKGEGLHQSASNNPKENGFYDGGDTSKGLQINDGNNKPLTVYKGDETSKTWLKSMDDKTPIDPKSLNSGDSVLTLGKGENGEYMKYTTTSSGTKDLLNPNTIEAEKPISGAVENYAPTAKQEGLMTSTWSENKGINKVDIQNGEYQLRELTANGPKLTLDNGDKGIVTQKNGMTLYNMDKANPLSGSKVLEINQYDNDGKLTQSSKLYSFGDGKYAMAPANANYDTQTGKFSMGAESGVKGVGVSDQRVLYNVASDKVLSDQQKLGSAAPNLQQGSLGKGVEMINNLYNNLVQGIPQQNQIQTFNSQATKDIISSAQSSAFKLNPDGSHSSIPFNKQSNTNGAFVKVGAQWCAGCIASNPQFDALSKQYGGQYGFYHLDVTDQSSTTSQALNKAGISSVPAVLHIKPDGSVENINMGQLDGLLNKK